MAEVKMTKAMWFEEIKAVVEASGAEQAAEMVEFIDAEMARLAAKAEKAKERAAAKKVEGDELREVVKAVLTDEFQAIDAIVAQIDGEDVTKAKVTARLTQLVKAEMAEKEQVKVGDRKVMAYRLK
jgi:exoribonuclease II